MDIVIDHVVSRLKSANVAHVKMGDTIIVVKDISLNEFEKELQKCLIQNEMPIHQQYPDFVNTKERSIIQELLTLFGDKYPMIKIEGTQIIIHYRRRSIKLDLADPTFFDQLDAAVTHFLSHDDFSAFVVPV